MIFGLYPNLGKENLYKILPHMIRILEARGISYMIPVGAKPDFLAHHIHLHEENFVPMKRLGSSDFIVSIGGDGTFLSAARFFCDSPVRLVGVHIGDLGFLNSILPGELDRRIDLLCKGDFLTEKRLFLQSSILHADGQKEVFPPVLNDVVAGHNKVGQMTRVKLWVNEHYVNEYPADGLLISTATGSTGYSLSCGGPVLCPDSEQIIVIPICAHSLNRFPILLNSSDRIKISLPDRQKKLHISFDGGKPVKLRAGEFLLLSGVQKNISFVRFKDQNFLETFGQKMISKICQNS